MEDLSAYSAEFILVPPSEGEASAKATVQAVHRAQDGGEDKVLFRISAVKARLSSGALLTDGWKASEEEGGSIRYHHVDGYTIGLEPDGKLRCYTSASAQETVSEVRLVCALEDDYDRCMVQGYQSWNLNRSVKATEPRRKSIANVLSVTAMFKDTDHPVWHDRSITSTPGRDSFDVIVFSSGSDTILVGTASCTMAQTAFWARTNKRSKVFSVFEMSMSFGVHSKPPGTVLSETLVLLHSAQAGDGATLLEGYGKKCKEVQYDDLPRESPLRELGRAPVGFGSWYQFYEKVTSDDMDRIMDVIKSDSKLNKVVDVIQLDDGFQLNTGDWLLTRKRFRETELSSVAKKIKGMGKTPGLWIAPFLVSKTSNVAKEHPDWLLRNSSGKAPLVGHTNPAWERGNSVNSTRQYVLDASNPEVLTHLEETFAALSQHWDLFKIDFLAAGMREGTRFDATMTRVEAFINGMKAIRKGAGPKGFILGCGAPMLACAQSGTLDAMRVTCDTVESWKPPFLLRKLAYDWDNLPSCETSLWGNMMRMYMHGTWWAFNDPDCLVLRDKGSSMTLNQVLTQVTVLGLTGGLLLFTDDMAKLEPERLKLGLRILPSSSLSARAINIATDQRPTEFIMEGKDAGVRAIVNWQKKSKQTALLYKTSAFEFWSEKIISEKEVWTHKAYQPCVLQYPNEESLLIGTTLHLTAIADGRILAENESQEGRIVKCTVSGDDTLAVTTGKLVFVEAGLTLSSSTGITAKWNSDDTRVLEVDITAPAWEVVVELS